MLGPRYANKMQSVLLRNKTMADDSDSPPKDPPKDDDNHELTPP